MSKGRCFIPAILLALGAAGPAGATPATAPQCMRDAVLVLDASGSMSAADFSDGGPNRMNRVRSALAKVVPDAARVRRLGFVVYGPGRHENSCRNIEVKFAPKPNAGEEILKIADNIRPAGRTALARSVVEALAALENSPKPAEIVVLTDGEDTCGGDPCGVAKLAKVKEAGITVHVIGFRLPAGAETGGASCLARETGGHYVTAETTDELSQALRQTLTCREVSRR